jgi:uncharacterized protein with FMN-binding domain
MKKSLIFLIVAVAIGIVATYGIISTNNNTNNTMPATALKDGTYSGSSESNVYETVQVSIVVSGGKITAVNTPVLSISHGGESTAIVNRALPTLKAEAIKKQSSTIDSVSGATYISDSFITSLDAAITAAKA